ncbi:MAG: anaerobic ribonucleoside-triphosphate reductase activating protein [Elusimicrobiota bacterium]
MSPTPPLAARTALLRLGGWTPLSTTDYPGRLAAVLFLQGCSWDCVYCHNSHLRDAAAPPRREWGAVLEFLRRRDGLLDAVVFSGGEPTLQSGLGDAMREVRRLRFRVGLHTAGPSPELLAEVLPLVDWVGFDVKAPFDAYERVSGLHGSGAKARESLRLLVASGVDHECRTTVHPSLFSAPELAALTESVFAMGARRHVLQAFRADGCRDEGLNRAADASAVAALIERAAALSPRVERRGVQP